MQWIETDSLSNQNISSALAIGAYTATGDKSISVQLFVDQVVGGGDYVYYLTIQIAGAGTSYPLLKTTQDVAAGVTGLGAQSLPIDVRTGDVLTVYVDGLAGDTTTPDTIVRWFEHEVLVTLDTSAITAIWEYVSRTLTMTAQQIIDAVSGSRITIHRGDTFTGTITTDPTAGYVSIDFSIKYSLDDADNDAVLRVRKNASGLNDGLLRLNGVVAPDATKASLTIAANSVQIDIDETITAQLPIPREEYYYDIQLITATTVTTLSEGRLDVNRDVTRLTS